MKRIRAQSGFTLIEILLVVILLAVLATVMIAQFNNVSADGKKAALLDQIRSVRAQVALYKMQHGDQVPALTGSDWTALTSQSVFYAKRCGPYFHTAPRNMLNDYSDIAVVTADPAWGDSVTGTSIGFVFNSANGNMWATNRSGTLVFNEENLDDPNNNN